MREIRLLLIDSNHERREARARRLRLRGLTVEDTGDAALGAEQALAAPPDIIVAELWMPSVSGVQLCRLMRSEASTCDVPVILCGAEDPKSRFWAERAGAAAYVVHGRTGELMRAIEANIVGREEGMFFTQLAEGTIGIRDRIARQLDEALFEAVIASEVRALAQEGTTERLFDRLAQLMSQVTRYRFVALEAGGQLFLHHHPADASAEADARSALGGSSATLRALADEDAVLGASAFAPVVAPVMFSGASVARLAFGPCEESVESRHVVAMIARELGGAVKMALLIHEAQHAATTDVLTGLPNRRAFIAWMSREVARAHRYGEPLSFVILDVDHFKSINDVHGHAAGDHVLATLGAILRTQVRTTDIAARWGGEEIVVAYTETDLDGAVVGAERMRRAIEDAAIVFAGQRIAVTASIGLAQLEPNEAFDAFVARADEAMYRAKSGGRNRVVAAEHTREGMLGARPA